MGCGPSVPKEEEFPGTAPGSVSFAVDAEIPITQKQAAITSTTTAQVADAETDNGLHPQWSTPTIQRRQDLKARGGRVQRRQGQAAASLGVVRLDYDYPAAPGDIDSPESYAYDVFYHTVPGLTFRMCQHANTTPLPDDIMKGFVEAIKYLDQDKNVSGSTRLTPRTRVASTH